MFDLIEQLNQLLKKMNDIDRKMEFLQGMLHTNANQNMLLQRERDVLLKEYQTLLVEPKKDTQVEPRSYYWTPNLITKEFCQQLRVGDKINMPFSQVFKILSYVQNMDYLYDGGDFIVWGFK